MSADEKERILTILKQLSRKPLFGFRVSEYSRIEPGSIKISTVPAEVPVEDRIHLLDSSEVMSPVVEANFLLKQITDFILTVLMDLGPSPMQGESNGFD